MATVTAAMTAERLAPAGDRIAPATGAITLGVEAFMITRAAGFDRCASIGWLNTLSPCRLGTAEA